MSPLRRTPLALLLAAALSSCARDAETLPPFGEVRLGIDTDLRIPSWVNRVRIDVFDGAGVWLDTRDFAILEASDFPLTFSLFSNDEIAPRVAYARVRVYPESDVRPYRGERFVPRPEAPVPPPVTNTVAELCATAVDLPLGQRVRVAAPHERQRGKGNVVSCGTLCGGIAPALTLSGLGAARLVIETPGEYILEAAPPRGTDLSVNKLDPILSLRATCGATASELACNDNADGAVACDALTASLAYGPRLTASLSPGSYWVLLGNRQGSPITLDVSARRVGEELPPAGDELEIPAPETALPRLVRDGVDLTPETEPAPGVTIDRFVAVQIEPKRVATASVLLSGNCLGTMSDVAGKRSCVDRENELTPVVPLSTTAGRARGASVTGTWAGYATTACAAPSFRGEEALRDGRACVEGGAFLLGDAAAADLGPLNGVPRRPIIVSAFQLDVYEVTVARYRDALARGFAAPQPPVANEFELEPGLACPLSLLAARPERAQHPLTCVSWYTARAFCQHAGGDLPTTAQREHAALAVGRPEKTLFPWGNAEPTCGTLAYGRSPDERFGEISCNATGAYAVGVADAPWALHDVTPGGIVGLGGNAAEWLRDAHAGYDEPCWQAAGMRDPVCDLGDATYFAVAGTSWQRSPREARGAVRQRETPTAFGDAGLGFRCAYPASGPGVP